MLNVPEMSLARLGLEHYVWLSTDFVLEFLWWRPVIFGDWDALSILVLDIVVLVVRLLWSIETGKATADHMAHFLDNCIITLCNLLIIYIIRRYNGWAVELNPVGVKPLGAHDLMGEL